MPFASLPMYDWPEVRAQTDALWARMAELIEEAGIEAPPRLTRDRSPADMWADPELLFSQTCGLPWVAGAARATRLIATPIYHVEGCGAGVYSSAIVTRTDGPEDAAALVGRRFAANAPGSLSGWAALIDFLGVEAIGSVLWTGTHRDSVIAVAEGRADAAAIDAVCWDMARRFEPAAARLRVAAWTRPAPATPFVTSALTESGVRARLRAALVEALVDDAMRPVRRVLGLRGVAALADVDYDPARRLAAEVRAAAILRPDLMPA